MLNMIFGISKMAIKNYNKRLFLGKAFFVFVISLVFFGFVPSGNEVYLEMESLTLDEGKYIKVKSNILFDQTQGKMVTYFHYPKEYFFVNNDFGEAKIYLPESNKVIVKYGKNYSTSSSFIYSFLNNQQSDFGLKGQDFQLKETYFEDQYLVTKWIPPSQFLKLFTSVKLVTENNYPVFCGYYDSDGDAVQKMYFSNYIPVNYTKIPGRITQISYVLESGDSSVNKITFSNLKTGTNLANNLRDFKIPEDAILVD